MIFQQIKTVHSSLLLEFQTHAETPSYPNRQIKGILKLTFIFHLRLCFVWAYHNFWGNWDFIEHFLVKNWRDHVILIFLHRKRLANISSQLLWKLSFENLKEFCKFDSSQQTECTYLISYSSLIMQFSLKSQLIQKQTINNCPKWSHKTQIWKRENYVLGSIQYNTKAQNLCLTNKNKIERLHSNLVKTCSFT